MIWALAHSASAQGPVPQPPPSYQQAGGEPTPSAPVPPPPKNNQTDASESAAALVAPALPGRRSLPVAPVEPTRHPRVGLLVRLSLGVGPTFAKDDRPAGDAAVSNLGLLNSFAVGGAITENFFINADFFGTAFVNADDELGEEDAELSATALGIGATYYLMPANVYGAASLGLGGARLLTPTRDETTDIGFALNLMFGKEWWIGGHWGLGLAGQFLYMTLPNGTERTFFVRALGLLLSASYN